MRHEAYGIRTEVRGTEFRPRITPMTPMGDCWHGEVAGGAGAVLYCWTICQLSNCRPGGICGMKFGEEPFCLRYIREIGVIRG